MRNSGSTCRVGFFEEKRHSPLESSYEHSAVHLLNPSLIVLLNPARVPCLEMEDSAKEVRAKLILPHKDAKYFKRVRSFPRVELQCLCIRSFTI